ncbi:MAG TPA: CusA/CzcA family heavy metal efflux RND transporter [Acidobacteriota bacterium]|nr:CusA/CzcA family heavy metal efflux RND transporter [Acidobacteriota bacterium]
MLNRIIDFSIRHRWLVLVLTGLGAAYGAFALLRLPIDAVPDISSRIVQITTVYPALGPTEMEKQIAFPLETALAGIPGLTATRSLSRNGFCQVEAVFGDDIDIYFARQQVLERLAEARQQIPAEAEPRLGPVTTGLGEIYVYIIEYERSAAPAEPGEPAGSGWQSDGTYRTPEGERLTDERDQLAYLRTVQEWVVSPQLRTVPGVAGVDTIGGFERQFLVQPDPARLVAYGVTLPEILAALERNNASVGAGTIDQGGESYVVRSEGRVTRPEEIGHIVVAARGGTPVHLHDVAAIGAGRELRLGAASENGGEVVVGTVLMLLGANPRTVTEAVAARVAEIRDSLPPGIRLRPVLVRTELVDKTIATVRENLFLGAVLVIAVLLLMLGNLRAAILTALAIPFSMLFTAIGMERAGLSANLMSLGAIDFGLIVDGAVIIVENCLRRLGERQRELGRPLTTPERLAVTGAACREVRAATAFGEAIIILVYIPILALAGVEGKMFHPMALTVIFALTAAFVLSLTAVPALVALVVRGPVRETENALMTVLKRAYAPVLDLAVRGRWAVVGAAAAVFAAAVLLFTALGQEFVPQLDEGNLSLQSIRVPSIALNQSMALQAQVERAVARLPEVELMYSKTGTAEVAFDPMPPNFSDGYIILKPRAAWPDPGLSKAGLIAKIQAAVEPVPGNLYEFSQPIELRMNELVAGVRGDLAVKVFGDDFETLEDIAGRILQIVQSVPGAADARMSQHEGSPTLNIAVDRATAARYGLNVADVQDLVATAIGGREAGELYQGDRRFPIVVRLPEALRADVAAIRRLPVPLPSGDSGRAGEPAALRGSVPLEAVARIEAASGPGQVNRENGKRRATVQANVRGRDLGSFVAEVRDRVHREVRPAPGTWIEWGGQYQNLLAARDRLLVVVPACFLLIFLMLFATFGSARDAAMVFTGVPLALTGGVLALWLRGIPFSISAAVGFIALSGVAVLNGLVMVTHINQLRRDGMELAAAIREGALTRLRPVLMTALVAALGFVPMAVATGTGAEVQRPLATVVIGGILSSTALTLLVLPALYRLWHRDARLEARD